MALDQKLFAGHPRLGSAQLHIPKLLAPGLRACVLCVFPATGLNLSYRLLRSIAFAIRVWEPALGRSPEEQLANRLPNKGKRSGGSNLVAPGETKKGLKRRGRWGSLGIVILPAKKTNCLMEGGKVRPEKAAELWESLFMTTVVMISECQLYRLYNDGVERSLRYLLVPRYLLLPSWNRPTILIFTSR
jgi:hypothetical protein